MRNKYFVGSEVINEAGLGLCARRMDKTLVYPFIPNN